MAFFVWTDSLNTGIKSIDTQHKKLVELINDLYNEMKLGKANAILGKILDELIRYTSSHFQTEEKYFSDYKYPEASTHILEHKKFVKTVENFKEQFDKGSKSLSIELMNFLSSWLKDHIKGIDKKYVSFLIEKGVK